jgi:hypothetical protein
LVAAQPEQTSCTNSVWDLKGQMESSDHNVGVYSDNPKILEALDEKFLESKLLQFRLKTLQVFNEIKSQLKEGMGELSVRSLANEIFSSHGVSKHWHKIWIRMGTSTTKTFHDPVDTDVVLKPELPVYFDLGPVWKDPESGLEYEGDYGATFIWGGENQKASSVISASQNIFFESQQEWKTQNLTGQALQKFASEKAKSLGFQLTENVQGHRIGDFPHHKYSRKNLASISFKPSANLWVFEVHLTQEGNPFGAFFEDILGVAE